MQKLCPACNKLLNLNNFGRLYGVKYGAKICMECNRVRCRLSYKKKQLKSKIKESDLSLLYANRNFLLIDFFHNIPYLVEDIYSNEKKVMMIKSENLLHSVEMLEKMSYGKFYRTIKKIKRVNPYKDKIEVAKSITMVGFRVLEKLEMCPEYQETEG